MITVTSATSSTGTAVADALLRHGHEVRAVGRNRQRLQRFVDRGADAAVAETDDAEALRAAFTGADGVFVMLAPGLIPTSPDYPAHQCRVITALHNALVDQPRLRRIVTLSGWAANYLHARGPVWGLRRLEDAMAQIAHAEVVQLRPGWFMQNAIPMIDDIRATGTTHGLIPADRPLPMISTTDIGAVAADILTGKRTADTVLELPGPEDLTLERATALIGRAFGVDARYVHVDAPTTRSSLLRAGYSPHMAEGITHMTADVADGRIRMLRPRGPETRTPTTFAQFLNEWSTMEGISH